MKVLLRIRSDVAQFPGGDYVHLLKVKETLEDLGMECVVSPGLSPIPPDVDAVHLFNLTRIHETCLQFRQARERGLPIALTPIWHSMREMRRFYTRHYHIPGFPIWAYQAAKELYYARRSHQPFFWPATLRYRALQREVAAGVDAILPNSHAELGILRDELGVELPSALIVPPLFDKPAAPSRRCHPRRDLLCAGRIEPRKNQLAVIRAFKALERTENRLVIFGSLNQSHSSFVRAFQRELVPGWVEYRGQVSLDELYPAYAGAKAVILASYFETCGFAVMEAMACGANACVSDTPYTRAFYGDEAIYCNPFSSTSISDAIRQVLAKPETDYSALLSRFSREHIADAMRPVRQRLTRGTTCQLLKIQG